MIIARSSDSRMEEGQQASEIKANESNDDLINISMIVDPPVIKDNWNI